ncbi:MAG: DUF721 domain-containing protein [bacterium]|nr:DUF721 domain-containing protein [bacterium]
MTKKSKTVEKVGIILPQLLTSLGIKTGIEQHKSLLIWNQIVGKTIATHTTPGWIKFGILFVMVDDSIWLQELEFLKSQILLKINEHLETSKLRGIKFLQNNNQR